MTILSGVNHRLYSLYPPESWIVLLQTIYLRKWILSALIPVLKEPQEQYSEYDCHKRRFYDFPSTKQKYMREHVYLKNISTDLKKTIICRDSFLNVSTWLYSNWNVNIILALCDLKLANKRMSQNIIERRPRDFFCIFLL